MSTTSLKRTNEHENGIGVNNEHENNHHHQNGSSSLDNASTKKIRVEDNGNASSSSTPAPSHTLTAHQEANLQRVMKELNCQAWPAGQTIQQVITGLVEEAKATTDAFFVADISVIIRQYEKWLKHLPEVRPYYAVKCNPSLGMVKTLEALGTSFDCASKGEIELVLGLGVSPDRIIYANPCKQISALKYAREHGVALMTFDNMSELDKIEKYYPEAKLIMRIAPDDSHSLMRFGTKFGVHPADCQDLLEIAHDMNLNVVGVSFHVGSGCFNEIAYDSALTLVRQVFDQAKALGQHLSIVDIGGGFSGSDEEMFVKFANVIKTKSAELFSPDTLIIAEPGRYFASMSHTLAVTVISKRVMKQEDSRQHPKRTSNNRRHYNYYIADGVYGSFNNINNDHAHPKAHLVRVSAQPPTPCTLFGPTCDSIDVIARDIQLPELRIGDWLYFPEMGAYTMAASSSFNGFAPPPTYYFRS
eukprot:TRINITY_DN988_c0_g2_i1.p1 TRINITY_DN988_c0_g2~~TRINITY_DN988_c0_g2_i1.p1  ORF type:complete len:473 (-),score=111.28 TRINITY_DN988_c0_g2_i1:202-1620(-)